MDPMSTYRIPMPEQKWISCRNTILTMWEYRERMGRFPEATGNWKMVDTTTYKTPFRPWAWTVGQGFIPVCVEFPHYLSAARGAVMSVMDAIGESRSVHHIFPRSVQPGIVDMMPTIHPDQLSLLTQEDIFAVVQLLSVHVTVEA